MKLNLQENKMGEYLLGKSRLSHMTNKEEYAMRDLIAKENFPAKENSLDGSVKPGLIFVGFYILSKALSEK